MEPSNLYWRKRVRDAGSATNIVGAYTPGAPGTWFYEAAVDERIHLNRMLVFCRFGGNFDPEKYGSVSELANGILVRVVRDDLSELDLLDGLVIKSAFDWARECYDFGNASAAGAGDNSFQARWTFEKDSDRGLILFAGDRFEIVVQDTLTLVEHVVTLAGDQVPLS